jgi:DNA invertase Pin-like site-specific DNA recombinase
MNTALIYVRVSYAEQTKNTSLESQEIACRDWCRENNLAVNSVFVESGESAKITERTNRVSEDVRPY